MQCAMHAAQGPAWLDLTMAPELRSLHPQYWGLAPVTDQTLNYVQLIGTMCSVHSMSYFKSLDQPVSAEQPCGIDLDSDPAMQAFLTMAEGALPASFREFDRKEFDDKGNLERIETFLTRSRDLRLLVLAAKTFALTENLDGFFECLDRSTAMLENNWDDVHPRAVGGDYALRTAYLQSFDDRPTIILPLQSAPLVKDKKLGSIAYRAFLVARKPAMARPGETVADESTLRDAFGRFEPIDELVSLRDKFKKASDNLQKLRSLFVSKASYEAAPQFELLPAFLQDVEAYLSGVIADRLPSNVEAPASQDDGATAGATEPGTLASDIPAGDIGNIREVSDALQAVENYFSAVEPSSPSKLLVRQAHQLVGKSFVEAMIVLAPELADYAKVDLSNDSGFSLSFSQMRDLAAADPEAGEFTGEARAFAANTRHEAAELMKAVEKYYRKWEPSSPIPLLLDRARRYMAKDFSTLLAEMVSKPD